MSARLTFRIVEEPDTFPYDEFAKDFMDLTKTRPYLQEKYNLSNSQYARKCKYAREVTGFKRPRGAWNKDKGVYITKTKKNNYVVARVIDGTRISGSFKDYKTAVRVRDIMVETDWDMDTMKELRKLYGGRNVVRDSNQYHSPLKDEALKKFKDFKRLFYSGEYSYKDILKELGFSKHQYIVCLNKLKESDPNARKKMVRS